MAKKKVVFRSRNVARDTKLGYMFLAPWIIGLVLFTLIPLVLTIAYSFANVKRTNFGFEYQLIGFQHYTSAFLGNLDFTNNLLSFLKMEISYVPVIIIVAFIIALILNTNIKGRTFFRIIFFLPVIIVSGALITKIFPKEIVTDSGIVLNQQNSALDSSFVYLMIKSYSIRAAHLVRYIYENFVKILWFTGIPIILFINGLNRINKNLYEAAKIDGANSWQILWKVTIPNIRSLAIIISVFSIVQLSIMPTSDMYALIQDSLGDSTQYGRTAAYSTIYAIAILLVILLFYVILKPHEKKPKRVRVTRTQKKMLDITLARMEAEGNGRKK